MKFTAFLFLSFGLALAPAFAIDREPAESPYQQWLTGFDDHSFKFVSGIAVNVSQQVIVLDNTGQNLKEVTPGNEGSKTVMVKVFSRHGVLERQFIPLGVEGMVYRRQIAVFGNSVFIPFMTYFDKLNTISGEDVNDWLHFSTTNWALDTKIACDSAGNIYLAQDDAHTITKFDSAGKKIRSFGGPATFRNFKGLAVGRQDTLFVTDTDGDQFHNLHKFQSDGTLIRSTRLHTQPGWGLAVNKSTNEVIFPRIDDSVEIRNAEGDYIARLYPELLKVREMAAHPRGVAVNEYLHGGTVYLVVSVDGGNEKIVVFKRKPAAKGG